MRRQAQPHAHHGVGDGGGHTHNHLAEGRLVVCERGKLSGNGIEL